MSLIEEIHIVYAGSGVDAGAKNTVLSNIFAAVQATPMADRIVS